MGVALQYGTIHECTRVALVCVTNNVLLVGYRSASELPLSAGGESAAAASAKAGSQDGVDNILGSHFLNDFRQSEVAVHSDVLIDNFRVDNTTVTESNTLLLLIELRLGQRGNGFFDLSIVGSIIVNKTLHDTALEKMFLDDLRNILSGYTAVEGSLGIYNHDRAKCTQTKATGLNDFDFVFKPFCLKFAFKLGEQRLAAGRCTTGTTANQNM